MGEKWRVFSYSEADVSLCKAVGSTTAHYSEFDKMLCSYWDEAMAQGSFRYQLSETSSRVLPGRHAFIAQNNPLRFTHRRRPAHMTSLSQPFDPEAFNFNKIRPDEILCYVNDRHHHHRCKETANHMLVINVSPIDYGHVLLIPEPKSCLPQVFTADSLQLCLELVALSGHSGFCMVANSLLAFASVNHLHYHFLYIDQPLLAATVRGVAVSRHCYELQDHSSRGFGFQLETSASECARIIFKVVSLLLECDLPHNIVMMRGRRFDQEGPSTSSLYVVRTLLIPRRPAHSFKDLYNSDEGSGYVPPFFAAACELGLGFLPVRDQSRYSSLTETEVLELLDKYTLPEDEFKILKSKAKELLEREEKP